MSDSSKNIKRGIIWSSISTFSRYVLQFGGIMILARLLSPSDYGLFGLLAVFISVADILVDSGLCGALIKKKDASLTDYSTLTTFNLTVSIFLYLLYFFIAPFVASYYNQPELTSMMRIYALYILIFALTVAPRARLTKDLEFKKLSIINIISGTIGLIVAITLALFDCGAMSIVGQYIAISSVTSLLVIIHSKYKFQLGFSKTSFKEQFAFGINTTVANILKSLSENIYNNIIGKCSNLSQTGYYTQSQRLLHVPVSFFYGIIDNTYFPIMSQIHDKAEFSKKIRQLNDRTFTIVIVLFTVAISMSKEIVYILLGEKWAGTESTLSILFGAGLFITWGNLGRNIIKSTGKTFLILKYETVIFVLCIVGVIFCSKIGYEAIVSCFFIISVMKSIYINYLAGKEIGVSLLTQVCQFKEIFIISVLLIVLMGFIDIANVYLSSLLKLSFFAASYGVLIYKMKPNLFNRIIHYGSN